MTRNSAPFLAVAILLVASAIAITIGMAKQKAARGELIVLTRGSFP